MKTTAMLTLTAGLLIGGTGCQAISDSLTPPPPDGFERFVYDQKQRETNRSQTSEELGVFIENVLYLPAIPIKIIQTIGPIGGGGIGSFGPGSMGNFGGIGNIGSIGGIGP
jgi:hypothetical protein